MKDVQVFSWGLLVAGRWLLYKGMEESEDLLLASAYDRRWPVLPPPSACPMADDVAKALSTHEAVCYCDGSGTTGEKPAGIGVAIYQFPFGPRLIAENIGPGTNNRAELAAIWRALKAIPDIERKILIRSDSEYAAGVLTKDWALKSNVELITAMREDLALRGGNVRFEYVPGHAGVEGNELADRMANIGRKLVTKVSPL